MTTDDGPTLEKKVYRMPPRPAASNLSPLLRASQAVDRAVEGARTGNLNAGAYRVTAYQQIQFFEAFVERLQGELVGLRQRYDGAFGEPEGPQSE